MIYSTNITVVTNVEKAKGKHFNTFVRNCTVWDDRSSAGHAQFQWFWFWKCLVETSDYHNYIDHLRKLCYSTRICPLFITHLPPRTHVAALHDCHHMDRLTDAQRNIFYSYWKSHANLQCRNTCTTFPTVNTFLWANAEWTVLCMTAWFLREKPNRWKVLRVGQTHLQSWERAVCENLISLLAKGSELIRDQRTGCVFKKKCLNSDSI